MLLKLSIVALIVSMGALEARSIAKRPQPTQKDTKKEVSPFKSINSEAQFTALTKDQGPQVVVFVADWCTACNSHLSALEAVSKNYPTAQIYTFDVGNDSYKEFRNKMEIRSFPTTIFMQKGTKQLERGSMGEEEITMRLKELETSKKK